MPCTFLISPRADPAFEVLAQKLEALLDRYSAGASATRREELRQLYVRAMELELAFFDAWNPRPQADTNTKVEL